MYFVHDIVSSISSFVSSNIRNSQPLLKHKHQTIKCDGFINITVLVQKGRNPEGPIPIRLQTKQALQRRCFVNEMYERTLHIYEVGLIVPSL